MSAGPLGWTIMGLRTFFREPIPVAIQSSCGLHLVAVGVFGTLHPILCIGVLAVAVCDIRAHRATSRGDSES
jgi:hypothetical protein